MNFFDYLKFFNNFLIFKQISIFNNFQNTVTFLIYSQCSTCVESRF